MRMVSDSPSWSHHDKLWYIPMAEVLKFESKCAFWINKTHLYQIIVGLLQHSSYRLWAPHIAAFNSHNKHVEVSLPPSSSYRWHTQGLKKLSFAPVYGSSIIKVSNNPCLPDKRNGARSLTKPLGGEGRGLPALWGLRFEKSFDDPTKIDGRKDKNLRTVGTYNRRTESEGSKGPHHTPMFVWSGPGFHIVVIGLNKGTYERVRSTTSSLKQAELTYIHRVFETASPCFPLWAWESFGEEISPHDK